LVPAATPDGRTANVALVQGNVPRAGLDFNAERRAVLENHANVTRDLARRVRAGDVPAADLVIWPENSSDIDPYRNADAAALIDGAVDEIAVPVLVGAIVLVEDGQRRENTGIVWDPASGPGATYVKRHPVPFAEYIPMRRLARVFSDKVDLVSIDQRAGSTPGVLTLGPATVGDVICFEVAYDGLVGEVVRRGAEVLVVQTNNATFGYTAETEQQLAMSRLRAREHGRSVVVAATSGVSAFVAPDGSVVERAELFTAKAMVHPVALVASPSIASRVGVLPEALIATVGLVPLLITGLRRRLRWASA
ncbi:MAG: apolipoprotein N-acyltransferase, partial [Actinomycetota bacterium]|nr:apolipoprotein N-acyltransferase [Actinomycetota bacterium]